MHLLLLIAGLLVLAAACGLLLAGTGRARGAHPPSVAHPPSHLSPLARQRAIQAYQAIHAMEMPADQTPRVAARQTTSDHGLRRDDEDEATCTFTRSSSIPGARKLLPGFRRSSIQLPVVPAQAGTQCR